MLAVGKALSCRLSVCRQQVANVHSFGSNPGAAPRRCANAMALPAYRQRCMTSDRLLRDPNITSACTPAPGKPVHTMHTTGLVSDRSGTQAPARNVLAHNKRSCRRITACAALFRQSLPDDLNPRKALQGIQVQRISDGQRVEIPQLWGKDDVTALIFARSFGCPFCQEMATQVARDILPDVKADGNKLFLVSIGSKETGEKFATKTRFPADLLFGDEENATYDALGLNQGLGVTYISPLTPIAIATRALKSGVSDLQTVLKDWVPWQPPKGVGQASIQGGTLMFDGEQCVWSHKDKATADHADMAEVLQVMRETASKRQSAATR